MEPCRRCFIGFYGSSPQIGTGEPFQEGWTNPMKDFIDDFYYYAIIEGRSVSDSINRACIDDLFTSYGSSVLYWGYTAWFQQCEPPHDDIGRWGPGQMHIIGSSSIHLVAHKNTLYQLPEDTQHPQVTKNTWREQLQQLMLHLAKVIIFPAGSLTVRLIPSTVLRYKCIWVTTTPSGYFTQDGTTYTTTINVYYTWGAYPPYITYQYSTNIELPYGSNYIDFTNGPMGGYFMQAYNYADSSTHYYSADTYWTGSGTSISVLWTW